MRQLSTGEWIAVALALIVAFLIFAVSGIFRTPVEDINVAEDLADDGEVVSEVPVPGFEDEVDEMMVNEEGASGTFPEGEVPEDISDEEAAAQ